MSTTTPPSASPAGLRAQQPRTRPCPNCAHPLDSYECGTCGWQPGLVPVAVTQTPDGRPMTSFAAEKRHKFMFIFGVFSCILGVIAIVAGGIDLVNGGSFLAEIIIGLLAFASGVMTLKNTRSGKAWWGLSAKQKAQAVPGLIFGAFLGLLVIPVLLLFWVVMVAMPKPGRDF